MQHVKDFVTHGSEKTMFKKSLYNTFQSNLFLTFFETIPITNVLFNIILQIFR